MSAQPVIVALTKPMDPDHVRDCALALYRAVRHLEHLTGIPDDAVQRLVDRASRDLGDILAACDEAEGTAPEVKDYHRHYVRRTRATGAAWAELVRLRRIQKKEL